MKIDKDNLKKVINITDAIEKIHTVSRRVNGALCNCPFHKDCSPSLSTVDDKGFYYCFGCGESGDMYDFYMKFLGVSFREAYERICLEFGYNVEFKNLDQSVYIELNKLATKIYEKNTKKYLKNVFEKFLSDRKLSTVDACKFNIGIAGSGNQLAKYIDTFEKNKKEKWIKAALETGLLYEKDNEYIDCFKGRIIFPIFNKVELVVGFATRKINPLDNGPKYKNSPSSSIFNKSDILYGENLVDKDADYVVIVEGYMDAISLYSKGIKNVVALMGVSLSAQKIEEILCLNQDVYLGLDNDEAGIKASRKLSLSFLAHQYLPSSVNWSPFKDPDEYIINNDLHSFNQLLMKSKPLIAVHKID
jgi:DNA primase